MADTPPASNMTESPSLEKCDVEHSPRLQSEIVTQKTVQTEHEVPDGGLKAWLVVLGGFFLSISTFGYFVSWAMYQAYYELVLLPENSPSQIAWIGSLQYSLIFLPGLLAGRLFDLGYFKASFVGASVLMTIANFLTAECKHYWQFVLCQGVLLGLSAGCIYIPCIAVVSHWFKRRRPIAFSIISFGGSVGGIIYPIIFRNLLPTVGFKWTVRTIAFINLATFIIACITMNDRTQPRRELPSLFDIRAFASPAYFLYVLSTFVAFLGLYTPLTFLSVSATVIGLDTNFAFYIVAVVNAASAVGRLSSGVLAVAFGSINVMAVFTVLAAAFTYAWPFATTKASFVVITLLYGLATGAFVCLFAIPVAQLGEAHDLGRRSGMQMTMMAIGALAGPPISGAIKQKHTNFQDVGVYAGTVTLVSVAIMLASKYCVTKQVIRGKF